MSKYDKNRAYGYTSLDNQFATELDKNLLPYVILGTNNEILSMVKEYLDDGLILKDSLALVAYLHERTDCLSHDVIEFLLHAGINPNNRFYSRIAIHQLYNLGLLDYFIDLLIECHANLNIIDDNGGTVLCYASARGDKDTTEMLINKGASTLIQDNYGMTALGDLNNWIIQERKDDDSFEPSKNQLEIIELLDKAVRKEMAFLGLLTKKQASIQNWRCGYFNNEDTAF